ncbi:MAG: porin family protein [Capnocytophaga sp.]|nr:porin family protein [Capnocytophaga sp.]
MKSIVKLLLIAFVGLLTSSTYAQDSGFTLKFGVNFNTISGDNAPSVAKTNLGAHLGLAYEISINKNFGIEPALMLDSRGFKFEAKEKLFGFNFSGELKTNIYYLNIPVNLKVKLPINDSSRFFITAGPYIGFGLKGTIEGEIDVPLIGKRSESIDIEFGNKDREFGQFAYGVSFGGGFELRRFMLGASYDLGLSEVAKDSKIHFNAVKISIGFRT